jgi:hypothetical protein
MFFGWRIRSMARKRHTAEEIVAKLRQVDVLMAQGRQVADAVRAIGVTEVTYYRWRNEYGGLKGDQVKRLKELETDHSRAWHLRETSVPGIGSTPIDAAQDPHDTR